MSISLIKLIASHTPTEIDPAFYLKMEQLLAKEEEALVSRKFKKILSQEYELERLGGFYKSLKLKIDQNTVMLKEKSAIKKNNGYIWVTINPKPSVSLQEFKTLIYKILTKTCFTGHLAVFEQRGTIEADNLGKGFHAHILFKRNLTYKPTKCITNLKQSCKKVVDNVNNPQLLNIKIIGNEFATDKEEYIIGMNKTGEGKGEKQEADKAWRAKEKLPDSIGQLSFSDPEEII